MQGGATRQQHTTTTTTDRRYDHLDDAARAALPRGESLRMCHDRAMEFWRAAVEPVLRHGCFSYADGTGGGSAAANGTGGGARGSSGGGGSSGATLVVSHMHTLRLIVAELDGISADELRNLDIPTATPLVYRLDAEVGACRV